MNFFTKNRITTLLVGCILSFINTGIAGMPEIIAHRGASYDAPENTIPAVLLAWEKKADAVEVDIHMTADMKVIAIHDKDTKRTTGKKFIIANTDWEDLKDLDAGSWKSEKYKGTKIPLLSEILEHIPNDKRVFVEIKCPSNVLPELEKVVKKSGLKANQIVFIAFDYKTISLTKKLFPKYECYWLSSFKKDLQTGKISPDANELVKRAKDAYLEGVNVNYRGPLTKDFVGTVLKEDLGFYVWTVNSSKSALNLKHVGVKGITTDRPGYIRENLKKGSN